MAYGITEDWEKIALIDTEHERGRFYANRTDLGTGEFLYAALYPPYSPNRYMEYARSAAEAVGEDGVVIVDSFSHARLPNVPIKMIIQRGTKRGKCKILL